MALPPQTSRPTTEPNRNGIDAAAYVETQRRLNELQGELLNYREKAADRSFNGLVIILTLVGIILALAGYVGFEKFDEIRDEISQHAEEARDEISQHVGEVERLVSEIEKERNKAVELTAEIAAKNPKESARTVASVQGDPAASLIDRAIAAAVQLQQQGKTEEAIEKWRSIANVAGEEDRQLQARAWFSIGYLLNDEELEAKIDAYTKSLQLEPSAAVVYNNRGNVKSDLGQHEAAIADYNRAIQLEPDDAKAYSNRGNAESDLGRHEAAIADHDRAIQRNPDLAEAYNNRAGANASLGRINKAREDLQKAIALAQEAGNETLAAEMKRNLSRLDNDEAP